MKKKHKTKRFYTKASEEGNNPLTFTNTGTIVEK